MAMMLPTTMLESERVALRDDFVLRASTRALIAIITAHWPVSQELQIAGVHDQACCLPENEYWIASVDCIPQ